MKTNGRILKEGNDMVIHITGGGWEGLGLGSEYCWIANLWKKSLGNRVHVPSDCDTVQSDFCHQGSPGHKKDGISFLADPSLQFSTWAGLPVPMGSIFGTQRKTGSLCV